MIILDACNEATLHEMVQKMQIQLQMINQSTSESLKENSSLSHSARQSQSDSNKLQTMTKIATLYLPATLVATIFSSSLVAWEEGESNNSPQGHHFVISSQFWVYVLITMGLTVLTFLGSKLLEKGAWVVRFVRS
jgi:preprotein translocase subunit SecY